MIFLTVGTLGPFDRLVQAVDSAIEKGTVQEQIIAQIGKSDYIPRNFQAVTAMEKELFDSCFRKASAIISHAGIGTISMALRYNKPLLAMPRLKRFNEHVNDHQLVTVRIFEKLGYLVAAYNVQELHKRIRELKSFVPVKSQSRADGIADRIRKFLDGMGDR